jgi:hypothetical protein
MVRALTRHDGSVLSAPTGFGKTPVIAEVARLARCELLVVCPRSVIPSWQEWMARAGVNGVAINYERAVISGIDGYGGWKIRGRVWQWAKRATPTLIVFDEAHRMRNRTNRCTKMLIACQRQGMSHVLVSATLAESPIQMYAIGQSVGLHSGEDYIAFLANHKCRKGRFAWECDRPIEAMAMVNKRVYPEYGYSVDISACRGFPANRVMVQPVPADGAAVDAIWQRLQELELRKAEDKGEAIVELLRLRQEAELLKAEGMADLATEALADGNSVCLFVAFRATLDYMVDRFGDVAVIKGGQSAAERQSAIEDFQANRKHVIVIMVQAGGVGVSLHDLHGRPRVSFLTPTWSATDLIQALGRIHRAGALSPARQYIVTAAGTVEEGIRAKLDKKVDSLSELHDADLRCW